MNAKTIYKVLGTLMFIEASLLLACLGVAIGYEEDDVFSFLTTFIVTMGAAFLLKFMGRGSDNTLSRRDAYMVVTLAWVVFSLLGTLPFLLGGYISNFTDAYFEAMSGFTTTGATMLDDVETMPHGILFWRSLSQWVGGLGIVFFTIALLPSMTGGTVKIFAAEATGPIRSKLHPRLSTNAAWIWSIYIILTIACILTYGVLGMGWFDAVNYALTTTATGGFSTHNDSAGYFQSPALEYACTFYCFLSGINFILLYSAVARGQLKKLFKNTEFRLYLGLIVAFTLYIAASLMWSNHYDVEHAFRCGVFQVVSFITSTGLFNDDTALWPHTTWVVLAVCMFVGGCSGSTSGGIKCVRGVMLMKSVKNELRQILHPNAVLPLRVNDLNIPTQKRVTLMAFLTAYLLLCLIASFVLMAADIDSTNAIAIILSCIGNVGPSLGVEVGPAMSWSQLPDFVKWMCTLLMLVGRLEIFSVLVIFTPAYWKEN